MTLSIFNNYRKDGVGLHTFTDKADGTQYLYTQFEADYCHWVMPCFDQPDLKAPWTFRAVVPEDWVAIANDQEDEAHSNEDSKKTVLSELQGVAEFFDTKSLFEGIANPKVYWFR